MPDSLQITCIKRTHRFDPHDRIDKIAGRQRDGSQWMIDHSEAIAGMESGKWRFWVDVKGQPVWLVVASGMNGHKYLKTAADADHPNNLLSLPDCE